MLILILTKSKYVTFLFDVPFFDARVSFHGLGRETQRVA